MTCLDDDTVLGLVEGRLAPTLLVELDVHLDTCDTCRAVIAQVSRANVVERGRTIGRYVIGDLLGTGAMGRVYAAWEPELDRNVAIKLLRDDSAAARARLLREAQAMARLAHPNVVTVHEVGTNGDDGVFVAMELVDGDSLRAWAGSRSWRDKVAMLVEVARGLAAVHAAGVIHRDVKPDNIIVGRDGRARLGDFGLARSDATTTEPAGNTLAVGSTAIAGTPAYMAPELLRGDPASSASDQFSFGVTAYEILAGARPFPGRTWAEIATAIATTTPAALPGPRWIDATIRRCLAADPSRRFPSMQAVAVEMSTKLARRRPLAWIAAAAVVASAATWFVVGGTPKPIEHAVGASEIATTWSPAIHARFASRWHASPDAPAALAAVDTWTSTWIAERDEAIATPMAARDACLDHRRSDFAALVAGLDRSAESSVDRVVDAVAAVGSPIECRTASGGTDPIPADRVDRIRALAGDIAAARAAIALGDARPVLDRTQALVVAAASAGHAPTLAEALLVRAEALRAVDRFADASVAARDAIAAAERGHDDAMAARAWLARVALTAELRALDQADDLAAVAAAAIDRAGAPDRLVAMLARIRGTVAFDRGDLARATAFVTDAGARFVAIGGDHSIEIAATDSILGSIERTAGDLDAAERSHRAALALDRELRGPAHPDVGRDLHNLAGVLRLRGDLDAAEATYRQALAIEVAAARITEAGLTHNSLGLVAMARHDWATARSELEAARDALGGHGDLALAEHNLGLVAAAAGDHAAALAHYKRAGEIYHATIGDDAASPIRLVLDRARSELALGHRDSARELAIRARAAARRANITWIADDATALVTDLEKRVVVAPPVVAVEPSRAAPPPVVVTPPQPPAQPKRDVGAYGSSHP